MRRPALFSGMGLMLCYFLCLAPSVHVHDAGELTAASWTLGIGHPPGAPLYMLLQKAFLLLVPFGHIAWRANLFSAMTALAAFFILEALGFALTKRPWPSAFGALAFALSAVFWSQAEMAEVYTLQAALLAGFLLSFVRARERGASMSAPAFLWGLLLTCHMGLALVSPLVWMVLVHPGDKGWKSRATGAFRTGLWMGLPLLIYSYLPLRSLADPSIDWGNPETLQNFWWHFSNRQVRGRMLSLPAAMYLRRAGEYGLILAQNLHLLLPFAALGFWRRWRDHRRLLLMLGAVLLMDAAFVVLMDTAPLASEAYAIPSVLALAVAAMLGLGALPLRGWAVTPALAAAASFAFFHPVNDLSRNFIVRDAAEGVLQQAPHHAALFTQEDNTTNALAYLVEVEGARRDLEIYDRQGHFFRSVYQKPLFLVPPGALAAYRKDAERPIVESALRVGRPVVFSSPFLDYKPSGWSLVPFGTLGLASPDGAEASPVVPALAPRHVRWNALDWMSRQILVEAAVREANAALAEGRGKEAAASMEIASLADIPEQCLRVAQLYLRMNESRQAATAARRAVQQAPDLAPAWSLLGYALLRQDHYEEAERALRRAVELDPSLPQPHASLGSLAERRGEYRNAAEAFGRSLALEPAQPEVAFLKRRAEICAEVTSGPGSGASISGAEVERLLMEAASAGFPGCVREWLGRRRPAGGREKDLAEAYLKAEEAVRQRSGNNLR